MLIESYCLMRLVYAGMGLGLGGLFAPLSEAVEATQAMTAATTRLFGLHRLCRIVLKMSGLFMLDAFTGGLVI
jgi:hypothetical protein